MPSNFRRHQLHVAHPAQPARPDHSAISTARSKVRSCSRTPSPSRSAGLSIRSQQRRQRGLIPSRSEVEVGRGKAAGPYEFGVKASIVTTNRPVPGGQFVLNARSLPDNPYDRHTLRDLIDRAEGAARSIAPMPIRNSAATMHTNPRRSLFPAKRGFCDAIKRKVRRRSAVQPIIGHLKVDSHLGRCYFGGRAGDAASGSHPLSAKTSGAPRLAKRAVGPFSRAVIAKARHAQLNPASCRTTKYGDVQAVFTFIASSETCLLVVRSRAAE